MDFIFQNKLNMKNLYSYLLCKCVVYISHTAGQSITSIYSSPNHCNNNITKKYFIIKVHQSAHIDVHEIAMNIRHNSFK